MKIDWSKAPEGATHFIIDSDGYVEDSFAVELDDRYKDVDSDSYLMKSDVVGDGWVVLARPPHWNGEGLPPVGTVCEGNEYGEWVRLEVIAHYEGRAVCMLPCKERVALADPGMLRHIRTPEQIAAEKREREIADIERVIKAAHYGLVRTDISPAEKAKHYAATLHDAGYRKTEQGQDR